MEEHNQRSTPLLRCWFSSSNSSKSSFIEEAIVAVHQSISARGESSTPPVQLLRDLFQSNIAWPRTASMCGNWWRDLPAEHPWHSWAGGVQRHERSLHEAATVGSKWSWWGNVDCQVIWSTSRSRWKGWDVSIIIWIDSMFDIVLPCIYLREYMVGVCAYKIARSRIK